jgi:hypothetical protein
VVNKKSGATPTEADLRRGDDIRRPPDRGLTSCPMSRARSNRRMPSPCAHAS